jgi:hypothetical protein
MNVKVEIFRHSFGNLAEIFRERCHNFFGCYGKCLKTFIAHLGIIQSYLSLTSTAAIIGSVLSIPMVLVFKNLHHWIGGEPMPFLNVMMWVYLVLVGLMVVVSLADSRSKNNPKGLDLDSADFKVSNQFAVISILIMGILVALYTVFY